MNNDGSIRSGEYLPRHLQALAAYGAWLRDPAISAQQGPLFMTQYGGAVMSMYQHLMGSGSADG